MMYANVNMALTQWEKVHINAQVPITHQRESNQYSDANQSNEKEIRQFWSQESQTRSMNVLMSCMKSC